MNHQTQPTTATHRFRGCGRMAGLASVAVAVFFGVAQAAHAQRGSDNQNSQSGGRGRGGFDPTEFFKRLDTNGNGTLDDNEISDRTRRYVERYGVDTSQPIKLDDLLAKIQNDSGNSNSGGGSSNAQGNSNSGSSAAGSTAAPGFVRKVPGFDVQKSATTALPGFAGGSSSGGDMSQYSDDIKEQVENVLSRYDANKNRVLDADEIRNARWGQPTPEESDLNRDGSLSVDELARRYLSRAQAERAISSGSSSNDQSGDSRSSRSRGDFGSGRGNSSNNDQGGDSNRGQESSTSSSSSSSSGNFRSSTSEFEKYRSYANGIVEKYDKDDDGKLNAEEMKAVRNAPANADIDGDGVVTAGELADAFQRDASGGNRGSASSGSQENASSSSPSRSSERSSRSSRSSSSRGGSSSGGFSFNSNDANGDGQVQMFEFTDEWSDEKLKEFRALDKNGDGVLTAEEFRGG